MAATIKGCTPAVALAVTTNIAAQPLFTHAPVMHRIFDSRPVALSDGMRIIAIGILLLLLVAAEKWMVRRAGRST